MQAKPESMDVINIFKRYTEIRSDKFNEELLSEKSEHVGSDISNDDANSIVELYRYHQECRDPNKEENIVKIFQYLDHVTPDPLPRVTLAKDNRTVPEFARFRRFIQIIHHNLRRPLLATLENWKYIIPVFSLVLLIPLTWYIFDNAVDAPKTTPQNMFATQFLRYSESTSLEVQAPIQSNYGFTGNYKSNNYGFNLGIISADLAVLSFQGQTQKLHDISAEIVALLTNMKLIANISAQPLSTIKNETDPETIVNLASSIIFSIQSEIENTPYQRQFQLGYWLENTLFACRVALDFDNNKLLANFLLLKERYNGFNTISQLSSTHSKPDNSTLIDALVLKLEQLTTKPTYSKQDIRVLYKLLKRYKATLT